MQRVAQGHFLSPQHGGRLPAAGVALGGPFLGWLGAEMLGEKWNNSSAAKNRSSIEVLVLEKGKDFAIERKLRFVFLGIRSQSDLSSLRLGEVLASSVL